MYYNHGTDSEGDSPPPAAPAPYNPVGVIHPLPEWPLNLFFLSHCFEAGRHVDDRQPIERAARCRF